VAFALAVFTSSLGIVFARFGVSGVEGRDDEDLLESIDPVGVIGIGKRRLHPEPEPFARFGIGLFSRLAIGVATSLTVVSVDRRAPSEARAVLELVFLSFLFVPRTISIFYNTKSI